MPFDRAQLGELLQKLVAVGGIERILVLQLRGHQRQKIVHRQAADAAAELLLARCCRGAAACRWYRCCVQKCDGLVAFDEPTPLVLMLSYLPVA